MSLVLPWLIQGEGGRMTAVVADIRERFSLKVEPEPMTGCFLWTGARYQGYGRFGFGGKNAMAHRVAYEFDRGPIPAGQEIDHLCRNRACVNPLHLEVVEHRVNVMRSDSFAARKARQTHCDRGHEFTPENTYIDQGRRRCRTCRLAQVKDYYARSRSHAEVG
jgi:hypothetical protein